MENIFYPASVTNTEELQQIIDLQALNLKQALTEQQIRQQGFLTMKFNLPMLQAMHELAPSIIVKDHENKVVAYAISFLKEGLHIYPEMTSMIDYFGKFSWKGRRFSDYNYYIMGQICVAAQARGKGLVQMLYEEHRRTYGRRFDCIVTEIAASNQRSMNAHLRSGFEVIAAHIDSIDDWRIVAWDWRAPNN